MDSKTSTRTCCAQAVKERTRRPVPVKREVAPLLANVAEPAAFSARAALQLRSFCDPAYREDFFAPTALFFRVTEDEAAIASANNSDIGWGGSAFTKDIARVKTSRHGHKFGHMQYSAVRQQNAGANFVGRSAPFRLLAGYPKTG